MIFLLESGMFSRENEEMVKIWSVSSVYTLFSAKFQMIKRTMKN